MSFIGGRIEGGGGAVDAHFRKGEIYGSREPGGAEGDANDLDQEAGEAEGVRVQHYAAAVAYQFGDDAPEYDGGEGPGAVAQAEGEVDDEGDDVEGYEGRVGGEGGDVFVDAISRGAVEGTGREGAVRQGAVGGEVAEVGIGLGGGHLGWVGRIGWEGINCLVDWIVGALCKKMAVVCRCQWMAWIVRGRPDGLRA